MDWNFGDQHPSVAGPWCFSYKIFVKLVFFSVQYHGGSKCSSSFVCRYVALFGCFNLTWAGAVGRCIGTKTCYPFKRKKKNWFKKIANNFFFPFFTSHITLLVDGFNLEWFNFKQLIFPEDHLMSRLFTPSLAKRYEELYQENGVKFLKVCYLFYIKCLYFVCCEYFIWSPCASLICSSLFRVLTSSSWKLVLMGGWLQLDLQMDPV